MTAFRCSAVGLAIRTTSGRLVDANPAYCEMLGYSLDDLQRMAFAAIVHPSHLDAHAARVRQMERGDLEVMQFEQRLCRKGGATFWAMVSVTAIRGDDGRFVGLFALVQDVTARKEIEARHRDQEVHLEALVEQLPIALFSQTPGADGAFPYVSPRFVNAIGYGGDDLSGSLDHYLEHVHPDDRDLVRRAGAVADRTGEPINIEYRLGGRDGAWCWVDERSELVRDEAGNPLAWKGIVLDVSERRRLEASLRDSERRFRRAFEEAAIGMTLGGPDHTCLDANAAYCRLIGVPREEIIGRSFVAHTHPDDRRREALRYAQLRSGAIDSYQIEKRYRRGDGGYITGLLTVAAVRDEHGQFLYDIGQLQDITAQRDAEAALRASEARLRTIVAQLPAAVYRIDQDSDDYAYVSPRFTELTGIANDRRAGSYAAYCRLVHPDDRADLERADDIATVSGQPLDEEYRILAADGSWRWVQDRARLMRDEDGHPRSWLGVLLDVSERKRLEAELEKNEAHLQVLVEQAPAALYTLEVRPEGGCYTYLSPQFVALTGLTQDNQVSGFAAFMERVHPDDIQHFLELDRQAIDANDAFDHEYRVRDAQGNWIWIHERSVRALAEHGQPRAWHGVLLDVTERKQLAAAVHEKEALVQSIFDRASIGMTLVGRDGVILLANPAMGDFLNYAPEALVGRNVREFTHPDDIEGQVDLRHQLQAGQIGSYQLEKRYRRRDGSYVWGLLSVAPVWDAHGALKASTGQVQDITARKEAEAALRDSEARFRALVQHDPDVIIVIDETRDVIYASPSAAPVFGISPAALLGPSEARMAGIHPDDLGAARGLVTRIAGTPGATATAEMRLRDRSGSWRWFQLTVSNHLTTPSIGGFVCNLRDISERKESEFATAAALQTQQAAIAELEQLNQSKSRFLSTISHEFRTPLTAIIGYSELLAVSTDAKVIAEDAGIIHREASRLNRMVNDVLLVEQMDAERLVLTLRPVDLSALARNVVGACRPLAEGHPFVLDLEPCLPPANVDSDRIAQALTNLISNAIKYSARGLPITISTRRAHDHLRVVVRDEGIGIAAADIDRIFGRFERIEQGMAGRIGGTGLGLAIAREIAELHGGYLTVESAPGRGSAFILGLPLPSRSGPSEAKTGAEGADCALVF